VKYLLDTTVLLDFAHGREGASELMNRLFADAEILYTCDVVTCEALSGGDDLERSVIGGVLDALEYVALEPDAARWAAAARRAGRSSPGARSLADALIAATAWSLTATVVTRNPRDFERLGIPVLRYA
jgi:predicted nucleic acid-binding protein